VKRKRTVYCIDAVTFKMRILNERRYDTWQSQRGVVELS
jgi:hypothetical protein